MDLSESILKLKFIIDIVIGVGIVTIIGIIIIWRYEIKRTRVRKVRNELKDEQRKLL
jgi:predicted small secreted protein